MKLNKTILEITAVSGVVTCRITICTPLGRVQGDMNARNKLLTF